MLWIVGWLLLLIGVFQAPLASLVTVWYESKTFNHGFLIFPLIGWFIWRARHRVAAVQPRVSWLAAILGMISALVELLGMAANVNILQHMALAGMLLFGAITFIGWRAAWVLWFPLSLLAFVPPLGEELVPLFQQITADLAVWMLQLTGVPVFRDGLYITIPAGNFEVAEACSGIRFFVACVFLGYLFGCINFHSIPKRIAFVLFGVALPIVANGVRVYGTILVGHFIDMKYAGGADHLVYGWFFFLLVIGVLVLFGTHFSDIRQHDKQAETPAMNPAWHHHAWAKAFVLAALPTMIAFAAHLYVAEGDDTVRILIQADGLPGTASQQAEKHLLPSLHNPSGSLSRTFIMNGKPVTLFVGWYEHNHPDAELISWYSRLYDINQWASVSSSTIVLPVPGQHASAGVERLVSPRGQRRALIYWYDVPGLRSHSKIAVKLQQALNRLSGRSSGGALVALSIPVTRETDAELFSLLENNGILVQISSTIVFK